MTNILEVESKIITLRGQQVILDSDVAELYGVETKRINEAVSNNPEKFPKGYIFKLDNQEFNKLRSKISTAKFQKTRQAPKAFTEKGLYMLATILKSPKAVKTTIAIVEAYAKLKELSRVIVEIPLQPQRPLWNHILFSVNMRSVRLQDCFQIHFARLLPAVFQIKDIMLLKRVARGKDMKHLFTIEIQTQRVCQALVNLIKAIGGNFFSIRFVEKVATKGEIGLLVSDKPQDCRHDVQLLSHIMADPLQGVVRGVHETDDFRMASGRLHVRTRDKAADMVGDEDEQRVFKPRLFRCRFKEFTNGEVGVGDTGLQKIIPLRHFAGIFLWQVEWMVGGERKDSREEGRFAFVELMRHILKEIHVPNAPNIGTVLARIVFLEVRAIVEFAYPGHLADGFKAHLVFRSAAKETSTITLLLQNARQPLHFTDKLRQKGERSLIGRNGNQD